MRPRIRRKGFSKRLRRMSEIDFEDDWSDLVIGDIYSADAGGPPNGRDPGSPQQGTD